MRRAGRGGFTLVEILMVVVLASLMAGIAAMRYIDLRNEAFSSSVAGDVQTIRLAALNYYAQYGQWPPAGGVGVAPTELRPFLPPAFSFNKEQYDLTWEASSVRDEDRPLLQVVISSPNSRLMDKLAQRLSRTTGAYVYVGSTLYYIINGAGMSI